MLAKLKGLFTPQAVAASLERLPDLTTTILDTAFPQRPTHPFPSVGVGELTAITGTVPVVRRSGQPVTVGGEEMDIMLIAPKPIKPAIDVLAAELNDLKMIMQDGTGLERWKQGKIDTLRRLVRDTTEAIASGVLYKGKVDWPSRRDGGGTEQYVVDYGSPLSFTPDAKLSRASKVSEVYAMLLAMRAAIRKNGIGGKVAFHAGSDVFMTLMDICQNYTSTATGSGGPRVELNSDQGTIVVGGFPVMLMDETYQHPVSGQWVDKLNAKTLVGFATDVPGKVWYCAIDSISAANAAVPFYVVPEALSGDTGIRLIAQSKPLPARNSKTTCTAIVVA